MDPNQIIGTPKEREVWLAPGWTDSKPVTAKQPSGYTRVTVRDVTYADGRIVTYVLDENHQPITSQVLEQTTDPEQQRAFQQQQSQAQRGDQEGDTRGPQTGETREEYRGGKWVSVPNPLYQNSPAGQNAAELERQRRANAALPGPNPNGATEEERRGQDPAYETDAERRARAEARIKQQGADAQQADQTPVDVSYTGTGKNRQKVTTYRSGRKVTEAAPTTATATASSYETRGGKPVKVTKYDDGTETVEEQKPTAGQVIKGGGPNGEDVQAVAGPDGTISYRPIAGATTPGLVKLPPGAPPLDLSSPEAAYSSTLNYYQWLDSKWRSGEMTAQQVTDAYAPAHTQAQMVIDKAKDERAQAQQQVNNLLTQRAQDITQGATRLGSANTQFAEANRAAEAVGKLADPGMHATTNTRLGLLALQGINASLSGGLRDAPPVVIPGPVRNLPAYPGAPIASAATTAPAAPAPTAQNAAAGAGEPPAPAGIPPAPAVTAAAAAPAPAASPAVSAPTGAPPSPPATGRSTKPMYRIDLGDEMVYYDAAQHPEMAAAPNVTLIDSPLEWTDGRREPKAGGAPPMKQAVPAAPSPVPGGTPDYGQPGMRVLPDPNQPTPPSRYGDAGDAQSSMVAMPTMALAGSLDGAHPYQPAIDALRAAGLSEDAIQQALRMHVAGGVAA